MATTESPTVTTVTGVVSVRVPEHSDDDLVTDAERRLGQVEGVRTATVDSLGGLDPRLSATVVTVLVTVETTGTVVDLQDRLESTVCVETVERLDTGPP